MTERYITPDYMDFHSADPEEIREELGLQPDASQSEVIAARRRILEASMKPESTETDLGAGE